MDTQYDWQCVRKPTTANQCEAVDLRFNSKTCAFKTWNQCVSTTAHQCSADDQCAYQNGTCINVDGGQRHELHAHPTPQ